MPASSRSSSRLIRAAGFTEVGPDEALSSEADVEILARTNAAAALFGEQAILQLTGVIGDEVMFAASEPVKACSMAHELVDVLIDNPIVPPARAGLAFGDVLMAGGDCFGPVVNLAARAVKHARPSTVVVNSELRDQLDAAWRTESLGALELSGFAEPVALWEIRRV